MGPPRRFPPCGRCAAFVPHSAARVYVQLYVVMPIPARLLSSSALRSLIPHFGHSFTTLAFASSRCSGAPIAPGRKVRLLTSQQNPPPSPVGRGWLVPRHAPPRTAFHYAPGPPAQPTALKCSAPTRHQLASSPVPLSATPLRRCMRGAHLGSRSWKRCYGFALPPPGADGIKGCPRRSLLPHSCLVCAVASFLREPLTPRPAAALAVMGCSRGESIPPALIVMPGCFPF